MQRSAVPVEGIEFTDKYGDTRTIHHNQSANGPLRVKRLGTTPVLAMNPVAAKGVGQIVHALRVESGWTLIELADRAGIAGGKQAMWAIENGLRGQGIRLGTLYALAMAFEVQAGDLLPSVREVAGPAGVTALPEKKTAVRRVA